MTRKLPQSHSLDQHLCVESTTCFVIAYKFDIFSVFKLVLLKSRYCANKYIHGARLIDLIELQYHEAVFSVHVPKKWHFAIVP